MPLTDCTARGDALFTLNQNLILSSRKKFFTFFCYPPFIFFPSGEKKSFNNLLQVGRIGLYLYRLYAKPICIYIYISLRLHSTLRDPPLISHHWLTQMEKGELDQVHSGNFFIQKTLPVAQKIR